MTREAHLPPHIHGDSNDHGRDGNAGDEGDPDRSTDQRSELPQNLLLSAPRLLSPESTARRTDDAVG